MKEKIKPGYRYRFAGPADAVVIDALLADNDLCHEDLSGFLSDFIVAERDGELAGVVGLELAGASGLLRSLAVVDSERGKGLGSALVDKIISHSRHRGVARLYLLTTTADRFFARKGFERIGRDTVPAEIQNTNEFKSLCPASAVCMKLDVKNPPGEE